jgi:hypothetical protein
MLYESNKLQEFQKLHESEINNDVLLLMVFRKFIDFITKTVYLRLVELTHLGIKSTTINTMVLNLDFGSLMLGAIDISIQLHSHRLRNKSAFLSAFL